MEQAGVIRGVGYAAQALELVGVAVIALAFAHALIRAAAHGGRRREGAYERLRVYLGKALLLGLEFLVAADIIRTVLIETTMESILSLGLLVLVRIVLGWSIAVEIEGCWPWQVSARRNQAVQDEELEDGVRREG